MHLTQVKSANLNDAPPRFFHKSLFLSLFSHGILKMFVLSNEDNAGKRTGTQNWDNLHGIQVCQYSKSDFRDKQSDLL